MNINKLKSKMVEFGDTQNDLAGAMGISLSRLNAKINNNNADFRRNEIVFISDRYNLNAEDIEDIFFAQ